MSALERARVERPGEECSFLVRGVQVKPQRAGVGCPGSQFKSNFLAEM